MSSMQIEACRAYAMSHRMRVIETFVTQGQSHVSRMNASCLTCELRQATRHDSFGVQNYE